MRHLVTEEVAIPAEIRIRSLALDALRRRWRAEFGRTPPTGLSRDRGSHDRLASAGTGLRRS